MAGDIQVTGRAGQRRTVAMVAKSLEHYRIPLYALLRDRLSSAGVDMLLYYPLSTDQEGESSMSAFPWAIPIPQKTLRLGTKVLVWQPLLKRLWHVDLVVVEQASKLLLNYVLMIARLLGGPPVAFWGHGRNFQATKADRFVEWVKAKLSLHVHWWFAYNEVSACVVSELGFPKERTTVVQNALDTRSMRIQFAAMSPDALRDARSLLGISGDNVCMYSGQMYAAKRIPFLLEAAHSIRERLPDFELIMMGSGSDSQLVEQAAEKHEWIHYVGAKYGTEALPYFAMSKLLLVPAAVGLVVMDSFAYETPLVTSDCQGHGPEIEYLVDGVNGIVSRPCDSPVAYALTVAELLGDPKSLASLREGCRLSADRYTIENMAERFAEGLLTALDRA